MSKKIIFFLISIILTLILYFGIKASLGSNNLVFFKSLIGDEIKKKIKNFLYSEMIIDELEKKISLQKQKLDILKNIDLINLEIDKKKSNSDIIVKRLENEIYQNLILKKFQLTSGFYSGINKVFPGSGYIDFKDSKIFILSSRGILAFKSNFNDEKEQIFKQIPNNIDEFLILRNIKKQSHFSLKDILVFKNKIFISYNEEIKRNCWNTSVIQGEINYEFIKFKKLFSPKECINIYNSKNWSLGQNLHVTKEFNVHQSGGRIVSFDENHILLTIGDYRSRDLAQEKQSVNGKIIRINILTADYDIISMGHRNPQGLYIDKKNNFILETEHGPQGGDEINLIEIRNIDDGKIQNYGWPISSAGEFYGSLGKHKIKELKKKYPLYNSHKDYGFNEPLYSFVPSIGISEIVKIQKNKYVVSSLGGKSLYFFELNEKKKILNLEKINVSERIRDLKYKDNKLYLFMENTSSIGVIDLT